MDDKIKLQQRVEIIAQEVDKLKTQGGGGSGEGYTKAEADAKFETQTHASNTYQTKSGMSDYLTTSSAASTYQVKGDYLTATDIADMATKTWVGSQGFLTDADEVPTVTSSDNGKILTASYSGGEGSYAWTDPQTYSQVQADWTQSDTTAVDYIKNKPTIPAAQVNADWNASTGVAEILNKPTLGTAAAAATTDFATATQGTKADTALQPGALTGYATETWVGQQGFLTNADEVPAVGSSDDGKVLTASYSGGTGSYSWETPSGGNTPATIMSLFFVTGQANQIQLQDDNDLLASLMTADNTIIGFKYTVILPTLTGSTKITGINSNLMGYDYNVYGEVTCKVSVSSNVLTGEIILLNYAGTRTIPMAQPGLYEGHLGYVFELNVSSPESLTGTGKWFVEPIYAT